MGNDLVLAGHSDCHNNHGRFCVYGELPATGPGLPSDPIQCPAPRRLHGVGRVGSTVERGFCETVRGIWEHASGDAADG